MTRLFTVEQLDSSIELTVRLETLCGDVVEGTLDWVKTDGTYGVLVEGSTLEYRLDETKVFSH